MNITPAHVVIVGRPNVGKSALFNRLIGRRDAIVDGQPGVTRDSKFRPTDWRGKHFILVDTGGVQGPDEDPFSALVQERIERTVRDAAVLLLVLDAKDGPSPIDHEVLHALRRHRLPIVAAVNKIDDPRQGDALVAPFYELGLERLVPVSALQGTGTGDLLDEIVAFVPEQAAPEPHEPTCAIAILGRPNVGKSTLLNSLCGEDRALVSPIPGTTRDPVDTEFEMNGDRYLLVDTAGIRRKGKMSQGLDRFCLQRAKEALQRCHLALLMIDGSEGLTETDAKVFGLAQDAGKAAIILVNKWDLVEKDEKASGRFAKEIRRNLPYLHYAPIEFISALTRKKVHRIIPHLRGIMENYRRRVPTAGLNELLESILTRHPPPIHKGRSPRIFYWTQVGASPPTFVAFASEPTAIHFSYQRYLVNRLYEAFAFEGTPLRLVLKKRGRRDLS